MNFIAKTSDSLSLLHAIHYSYVDPGMDNGTLALTHAFLRIQQIIKPLASLEIGAHDADFSIKLKKNLPETDVVAYEGSKAVFDAISKQIDFSHLGVKYCHGVVSDLDGTVTFREMYDAKTGEPAVSCVSSLLPRLDTAFIDENNYCEKDVSVQSVCGDSLLAKYGNNANVCIWIDAEGANRQILHGLEASFRTGKIGSCFIEVEQKSFWENQWLDRDVYAYLVNLGYFLLARDCQHHRQYNMLFVRNDLVDNQLFMIVSQEYNALSRLSELRARGADFRCSLSLLKGDSFYIGKNQYILSKSPDPRVLDLYSSALPRACCYSVVFTGMHTIDIRIGILLPGIPFNDSPLNVFDDERIIEKLKIMLLNKCQFNSYELKIGQRPEYGFLALSLPYSALSFDHYLRILISFIEVTSEFL